MKFVFPGNLGQLGSRSTMPSDDFLLFAREESRNLDEPPKSDDSFGISWKILVVDDDEEVLSVTRLVLRKFDFEGKPVQMYFGTSGADARRLMQEHPDAAVLLLDVVMEAEDAGLDVVRHVRDDLKNYFIRIILRTGQPGFAPEEKVFVQYEINDYKEKSFLTGQNLITSILSALRSYRDLRALENMRKGLTKIIDATEDLFKPNSLKTLASGILTQLSSIIGLEHNGVKSTISCIAFSNRRGEMKVYAGSGRFEQSIGSYVKDVVPSEIFRRIEESLSNKQSLFFDHCYLGYFQSFYGVNFVYIEGTQSIGALEKNLVEVFSANISFAFDKLFLNREIFDTQRDVTFALGEVIEIRSQEAGHHVRRVAMISRLLAEKLGMDEAQADLFFMASPLHDLGMIGVSDHILKKPGSLDPKERETMQAHTIIGNTILDKSPRAILKAGAIIAHQHHERWDGRGYPNALCGNEIHSFARITAVADVFDALLSRRYYREAWDLDRVLAFFKEERGKHFDPELVDVLFKALDRVFVIVKNFNN